MNRVLPILVLASVVAAPIGTAFAGEQSLALFIGITDDRGDNAFSLGLDYEYKFTEIFGIGGLVDHAGGDVRTWVVGAPIFAHPVGGLVVLLAPGIEHQDDGDNEALVRSVRAGTSSSVIASLSRPSSISTLSMAIRSMSTASSSATSSAADQRCQTDGDSARTIDNRGRHPTASH